MVLRNQYWQEFIGTSKFAQLVNLVVTGEGHVISQWGPGFRPSYRLIGTIRAFLKRAVPFVALSATFTPEVRLDVQRNLLFRESALWINLGNDRINIKQSVVRMEGSKADPTKDLQRSLPENLEEVETLEKTLWFFNTRESCVRGKAKYLQLLPNHLRPKVAVIHSLRSNKTKNRITREFMERESDIRVLFCTEIFALVSIIHCG